MSQQFTLFSANKLKYSLRGSLIPQRVTSAAIAQPLILSPEPQLHGVAIAEKVAVEHFEHQIESPYSEENGLLLEKMVDNNLLSKDSMGMVDEVPENNNESASENLAADVHKTPLKATEYGENSMAKNLPKYTMDEIARHNTIADLWVVIDNDVYDMTEFQHKHPGGYKGKYKWFP